MRHIDLASKDGKYVKISDDNTYEEIRISFENEKQAKDIMIQLIVELLKGE